MRNYTATNYPPHTLAPDPQQMELKLQPRLTRYHADVCPRCGCLHTNEFEAAQCRQAAREQR